MSPIISVSLPADNTTADVADYNAPITSILATVNGLLDDDNIASLSGTKIVAGTLPITALSDTALQGWVTGLTVPNTITYNQAKNYDLVVNSTDLTSKVSAGMVLRLTRTVAPPTQCADLEAGSSQYYSKSSPNKMTWTDDWTAGAWVKLESYADCAIISRFDGSSGWIFKINSTGQVSLIGLNGGAGNQRSVTSNAAIPLNRWVHVAAQMDMSTYTLSATTCYTMIDGFDVSATLASSGTNPTALVQAGSLNVGAQNGSAFFDGKLAQVAVFNAKVTQATLRTYMSQTLSGSETALASAYSFNNSIADLNTSSPNDLTASGGALATNTDSPFHTTEYAEIVSTSFSTNTTLNVIALEGYSIPTNGGVSAVAYSAQEAPYGLPRRSRLLGVTLIQNNYTTTSGTAVDLPGLKIPIYVPQGGAWVDVDLTVPVLLNSGNNINIISIWDGAVASGTELAQSNSNSLNTVYDSTHPFSTVFLSAGLHTISAGMSTTGGTMTIGTAAGQPAVLRAGLA